VTVQLRNWVDPSRSTAQDDGRCARIVILSLVLFSCAACSSSFEPSTQGKKLISYGQDWPNAAYVRAHITEMEKRPFDGLVLALSKTREPQTGGESVGFSAWGKARIEYADYLQWVEDLKATAFKKFTDNFVAVESQPGDADWFSDQEFASVTHNLAVVARAAKQGGCKGIEFDPEEYGPNKIWSWRAWAEEVKKKHSEEETIAMARKRGAEVMAAINAEFPGIKILFLGGPSWTYDRVQTGSYHYRLLSPFIEGMASVASSGTELIDGFEQSYPYRTRVAFADGRKDQLNCKTLFENKADFGRCLKVGFGLWMDEDSGHRPWNPDHPEMNHFQPDTWQSAIHYSLAYSDEYVWIWHEQINFWTGKGVSQAYLDAQEAGRKAPGRIVSSEVPGKQKRAPIAANVEGHDDQTTFGDLLSSQKLIYSFPTTGWKFKTDPNEQGDVGEWFALRYNDSAWKPIEIGKYWDEQGYDYDGYAWYRINFNLDSVPKDKPVNLVVGAADESAWIFVNGEYTWAHDIGEGGWNQRFSCDISKVVHPGQNQLTIRVLNRVGPGGLWKGIKIFTAK
jgi:hypothetical protein